MAEPNETSDKEPKETESELAESELIDDPKTDDAVEDIVRKEGDELLEMQDKKADRSTDEPARGFWGGMWHLPVAWWRNKPLRWITFLLIAAVFGTFLAVPAVRYAVLNTFGVRVSTSLSVEDSTTGQPLKNTVVSVDGASVKTNNDGNARIVNLKLGPQKLTLKRTGFASQTKTVTLGWGSNPLGIFKLKAVGVQYVLQIRDFASDKPVANAEAASGDASAVADKNGKIVLVVAGAGDTEVPVTISASGYRSEQIAVAGENTQATTVSLVPSRKEVFVARQDGKYNLYKIDVDGQNKQLVLAGSGNEAGNMSLVVSPAGDRAAWVATRLDKRSPTGVPLNVLSLVSISDGSAITLAMAEHIQLIDWIGSKLIFRVSGVSDTSATPRSAVVSYDYKTDSRAQLASANNLTAVMTAQGEIFYATGADDAETELALYRIRPDGSGRQKVLEKEVWSGQRIDYNTLNLQTAEGWYSYSLVDEAANPIDGPASLVNRIYISHPSKPQGLWIDSGQVPSKLQLFDASSGKDQVILSQTGLTQPVRWLTDTTIVVRIVTSSEAADYVVGTQGGAARKITDVINTSGFTQGP